jgi:hypothetical protein
MWTKTQNILLQCGLQNLAVQLNALSMAFHSYFNDEFYSAHPCIYVFIDVLKQIQTTTYIKIRGLDNPATNLVHRSFVGASGIISYTQLSSVSSGGRKGSPKNWDSHLPISLDLSL